jgi:hypothetical protein
MVEARVYQALRACCFKEAIITKHGGEFQATVINNESNCPIDGIWCSDKLRLQKAAVTYHTLH